MHTCAHLMRGDPDITIDIVSVVARATKGALRYSCRANSRSASFRPAERTSGRWIRFRLPYPSFTNSTDSSPLVTTPTTASPTAIHHTRANTP